MAPSRIVATALSLIAACICGKADADELHGRATKSDATPRITRPQTPALDLQSDGMKKAAASTSVLKPGTSIEAALDPRGFLGAGRVTSPTMTGELDDAFFTRAEHSWHGSNISRDTGFSNVTATVSLAVCPPFRQEQRMAWKQLMLEISDQSGLRDEWWQWQESITNELMLKRFLGTRAKGRAWYHVVIKADGTVDVGGGMGPRVRPRSTTAFEKGVLDDIDQLGSAGKFRFPSRSAVTQLHAMIYVGETPNASGFPY